jgi:hypothetical protein
MSGRRTVVSAVRAVQSMLCYVILLSAALLRVDCCRMSRAAASTD